VNEFVAECRSEWSRLGVPDAIADEMAAELAADLQEAAAEGASAEDVLGESASDPRAFAAAWAAERGLIRQPTAGSRGLASRAGTLAVLGAFAVVAIVGAVLVVLAAPAPPGRVTIRSLAGPPMLTFARPLGSARTVTRVLVEPPRARAVAVDINDSRVDTRTVGSVLLIIGLAGVVPLTILWLWIGPPRLARRLPRLDDRSSAPGN
jgi:hypothetical protein